MYTKLEKQLNDYYRTMINPEENSEFLRVKTQIMDEMDSFYAKNPDLPSVLLKSRLHSAIAAHFVPVIFSESPFYYEMGLRQSLNWGTPSISPSAWLLHKRENLIKSSVKENITSFAISQNGLGIALDQGGFDIDHHCIGYTRLFEEGITGLVNRVKKEKETSEENSQKYFFCMAAEESCNALLKIADKFAASAKEKLNECNDERQKRFLNMIIHAAPHIPASPPKTFYEGLAMLWFLREVMATLEGIGISVLGHLDRLLGPLYEKDLQNNRIIRDEAKDLLARWMMPTDIKFMVKENQWPEASTCIELGGCDSNGELIFNEVTRMIIEVHEELHLLNPKLNCRFSSKSSREYLKMLGKSVLNGHNNYAFLNDDVIIPSLIRIGKAPEEARLYVNGGCQETMVEGVEHTAGAYFYFNLPRILDLCLQEISLTKIVCGPDTKAALPHVIENAQTFESFYDTFMKSLKKCLTESLRWRRTIGNEWVNLHPCPLFSATLNGTLESGRDYTAGGAKYNPSTVCAVGLATLIDSLFAIKKAIYDDQLLSLDQLRAILASNWIDNESMRQQFIALPKYGHGVNEVDQLASQFVTELNTLVSEIENERNGKNVLSMFVYYGYEWYAPFVRATPDGRKNGDLLSQGISPSRLTPVKSITDSIRSIGIIPFMEVSGNSVLDIQLPVGSKMDADIFVSLLLAFADTGGPTLQPNVVSIDELKDAKIHPENHRNLIVRICGLSAYFIQLTPEVQNEIIERNMYAV